MMKQRNRVNGRNDRQGNFRQSAATAWQQNLWMSAVAAVTAVLAVVFHPTARSAGGSGSCGYSAPLAMTPTLGGGGQAKVLN